MRVVVLVSGGGSNLASILEATKDPEYGVEVIAVGADRPNIGGLDIAEAAGIPTFVCSVKDFDTREEWDRALAAECARFNPELVVSAGFMKLVGVEFLRQFPGRFINTHPALLPSFPGTHGARDALDYGVKITGATLFIVDEGVDTGAILAQVAVPVEDDDDVETLTERIKVAERVQIVNVLGIMARDGWTVDGRHARLGSAR